MKKKVMNEKDLKEWINGEWECKNCEFLPFCDDIYDLYNMLKKEGLWNSEYVPGAFCNMLVYLGKIEGGDNKK